MKIETKAGRTMQHKGRTIRTMKTKIAPNRFKRRSAGSAMADLADLRKSVAQLAETAATHLSVARQIQSLADRVSGLAGAA